MWLFALNRVFIPEKHLSEKVKFSKGGDVAILFVFGTANLNSIKGYLKEVKE